MTSSKCTVTFTRNDLQKARLSAGKCPVKNCMTDIQSHQVPFQRFKGQMRYLPYCPEHGIRIHKDTFVYYNGSSKEELLIATKRNLPFHANYYVSNVFKKGTKMESGRLCYETSEDAVSYNVFTEMLAHGASIINLVKHIIKEEPKNTVELHLWGGKIDLENNEFILYKPLINVRKHLERDIKNFATEPDIMLVVDKQVVICIEAKFGGKNPIAEEKESNVGEKPKSVPELRTRYCEKNNIIDYKEIFDFSKLPKPFYEQLFRNIVFAASMAKLEGIPKWYVVNLRNQHAVNIKKGKPESKLVIRNIRSILKSNYKSRFIHMTWEDIYDNSIKGTPELSNLTWYLKTKSLNCTRAFNIL